MKQSTKFSLIFLVVIILITAFIQLGQKEPINWSRTYKTQDKFPFGTFVLSKEWKHLVGEKKNVQFVNQTVYDFLEKGQYQKKDALFILMYNFEVGNAGRNKLLNFVENGGSAFLVANYFDQQLFDTLGLQSSYLNAQELGLVNYLPDPDTLQLYASQYAAQFNKLHSPKVFEKLPDDGVILLGGIQHKNLTLPNFIQLKYGKGVFYIHLEPDVFTNYYLLQEDNYFYIKEALKYLKDRQVYFFDQGLDYQKEQTPLRFILSQPALKTAWYILLLVVFNYLVFKGKREQRAIPVIEPEPNLSIAFAQTISSLYYENGQPGNMVLKKIEYFLYNLRKQYYLDTQNLMDPKFIQSLSQRSQLKEEEIRTFLLEIIRLKEQKQHGLSDLKYTYQLIEAFKQKTKIL